MARANDLIARAFRLLGVVDAASPTTDSVTAQTVVTTALKLLGVIEATETPQADDLSDGRARLNDLIKNWPGATTFADNTTPVTVPKLWARALPYNLALEIAPMYGVIPSELIAKAAAEGLRDVQIRVVRDDALNVLNAMLEDWPLQRSFAEGTTDYPLPESWERAIPYNLALELGPMLGVSVHPSVVKKAGETLANVKRRSWTPTDATFDPAIGTVGGGYDIYSGE